jgi:hypothetical protein
MEKRLAYIENKHIEIFLHFDGCPATIFEKTFDCLE